jgi:hypothetical protein
MRPRTEVSMNAARRLSCIGLVVLAGSAHAQRPAAPPSAADPVVAPLPAGTLPWDRPPEWTADARPGWREHIARAAVVVDQRVGGCRLGGPAFENALAIECGVVLAGLKPGTRRSEVEALIRPLGGTVERFPESVYAEAVARVRAGAEPSAAIALLDDTARVRYVSFKWIGTLALGPVPLPPVAGMVERVVDSVAVRLRARPVVVERGDSVRFVAAAHNSSARRVRLSSQCGPPMDVVITGPGEYRVWLLAEMLGPHGDFTCEVRRSHHAEPRETERQQLVWRAPNRRGEYTAVAGLRGENVLKQLSAPVRITIR